MLLKTLLMSDNEMKKINRSILIFITIITHQLTIEARLGDTAATSAYGHRLVKSNLSGLYVDIPIEPIDRIRLYLPFHECLVTK